MKYTDENEDNTNDKKENVGKKRSGEKVKSNYFIFSFNWMSV